MKILIYEPDPGGHRFTAVRMLIDALAQIDSSEPLQISLASIAAAVTTEEFELQLAPVRDRFDFVAIPGFTRGAGSLKIAAEKVRVLSALLAERAFDHLYIPYADGMLQMLGVMRLNPLFRWPANLVTEALLMRGGFAYAGAPRLSAWTNLRTLSWSGSERIHWIDPLPARLIARKYPRLNQRCNLMPDPTPYLPGVDRQTARNALQLPAVGRLLGCVGRIDQRKGMDRLINAFARAELQASDRLLLAGRQTDEIRRQIESLDDAAVKERIISIDRYLDNDELLFATSAIDLMVTPYPDFVGSVSIVARAAMAQRMSLGADTGWMGYVIPAFELGRVCDLHDQESLTRLLPSCLAASTHWQPGPSAQAFLDFMAGDNVRAHWTALIRARLGAPLPEPPRQWPDLTLE